MNGPGDPIAAGVNPGGLVARLYVAGELVDEQALDRAEGSAALQGQLHSPAAVDAKAAGLPLVTVIYDGDHGMPIMAVGNGVAT